MKINHIFSFSGLESVPLKMSFWHNPRNPEESILMYGDNQVMQCTYCITCYIMYCSAPIVFLVIYLQLRYRNVDY